MDNEAVRAIVKAMISAHCDLHRPFQKALLDNHIELPFRPRADAIEANLTIVFRELLAADSHATLKDSIEREDWNFQHRVERWRCIAKRKLDNADFRAQPIERIVDDIVDLVLADALGRDLPPRPVHRVIKVRKRRR